MKFLLSTGLFVVTFACVTVLGYNEFLIENRVADKCETCKYFVEFYNANSNLNKDDVEEVYREFYELAQTNDEDACSNYCANAEFVEPQEVATSGEESSENLVENLIAHVGCATCLHIVQNVHKHIKFYGFRGIIAGFKYACFNDVTHVCKSFLEHHEDELIDAIYHFKQNTLPVCKSIHQC